MTSEDLKNLNADIRQKLEACRRRLRELSSVVVAFSAGVDSTFLLALAAEVLGRDKVIAAMGVSPALPQRERQAGHEIARQIGVELLELETAEMDDPNYATNPPERCFYCKSELFNRLKRLASQRGFAAVASGANADDVSDFRPGIEAGRQLGVVTPLLAAGLRKDDIRAASRAMHLRTWNKSSLACLASRVPYGQKITAERLARIEQAEDVLKDLGFRQCRLRDHEPIARIEVPPAEIARAVELREKIVESLKDLGYTYITLDLCGFRSGSMNEPLRRGQKL